MNYIWCGMILFSLIVAAISGTLNETVNAAFAGAQASVETVLSFAGVMCFWTGMLKLAEKSGISEKIEKLLSPVVRRLFKKTDSEARKYISMNITANMLGMGNAATPMGIKAMSALDKHNKNPLYPSDDMCMFVVLNTTSFQLIPTTIIALRAAASSQNPFSVILPIWITSAVSIIAAVTAVKIMCKFRRMT
ncbi:MAG: spore maturation protein [Clostridia bacterium]|nr:spore maturation protein [Clostridia bacterium]